MILSIGRGICLIPLKSSPSDIFSLLLRSSTSQMTSSKLTIPIEIQAVDKLPVEDILKCVSGISYCYYLFIRSFGSKTCAYMITDCRSHIKWVLNLKSYI